MKSNHKIMFALAILAMGVHAAVAQDQSGPPFGPPDPATMAQHRVQFLTNQLSLTSQQQQQALTIFTSAATTQSTMHDSMKTAHDSLRTAIKANDANGIAQAANTIGNLTAQATVTQAKAEAALYAILTPDQQTKFGQLESHGPGMRAGGHGPMPFDHP
jgi:Spy/CpxP family protein refolding chaperone